MENTLRWVALNMEVREVGKDVAKSRIALLKAAITALLLASCMSPSPANAQPRGEKEWVAAPTFFAARSDTERCAAIEVWLSSIREEGTRTHGDLNQIQVQVIRRMAVPAFRGVFGKTFAEMSKGEKKQVAGALKKCSKELWVEWALAHPFRLPEGGDAKGWIEMFDRYGDRPKFNPPVLGGPDQPRRSPDASCARGDAPEPPPGHKLYEAGELLLETGLYRLYGRASWLEGPRVAPECWCSQEFIGMERATLSMVFKADERYRIKNDEEYWRRFEHEILPVVLARCSPVMKIQVLHHVEGFYLDQNYNVSDRPIKAWRSEPLSDAIYQVSTLRAGGVGRGWTDRPIESIADVRATRKAIEERDRVREEEERRAAEQKRAADLARRRVRDRAMSAEVLKVLELAKGKAPEKYDFSGYEQCEALENIYGGNFEPLNGGYEYADQFKIVLNLDFAAGFEMSRLGALNSIAYYAYHQEYAKQCLSNKEIPWEKLVVERSLVSKEVRGFFEIERNRWPLESWEFWVRRPFWGAFSRLYKVGKQNPLDQALVGISPTLLGEYGRDFEKFLKREGCGSPAVRHFEVNLHLVTSWMMPLQELK
jgi:hypothetical protein